jgi:hypothetical protein
MKHSVCAFDGTSVKGALRGPLFALIPAQVYNEMIKDEKQKRSSKAARSSKGEAVRNSEKQ